MNQPTSNESTNADATLGGQSAAASATRSGFLSGILIGGGLAAAISYYIMVMTGAENVVDHLAFLFNWAKKNLGYSLPVFSIWLAAYIFFLNRLVTNLKLGLQSAADADYDLPHVIASQRKLVTMFAGLFLMTGVLFTAVGMYNSLTGALGSLDAETAAKLGAFNILRRLVDEGIMLALSSTIVGLGGMAIMQVYTEIRTGKLNRQFNALQQKRSEDRALGIFKEIRDNLITLVAATSSANEAEADAIPQGAG